MLGISVLLPDFFSFLGTEVYSIHLLVCTMNRNKILFLGHLSTSDEYMWREKIEDRSCLLINEEFSFSGPVYKPVCLLWGLGPTEDLTIKLESSVCTSPSSPFTVSPSGAGPCLSPLCPHHQHWVLHASRKNQQLNPVALRKRGYEIPAVI